MAWLTACWRLLLWWPVQAMPSSPLSCATMRKLKASCWTDGWPWHPPGQCTSPGQGNETVLCTSQGNETMLCHILKQDACIVSGKAQHTVAAIGVRAAGWCVAQHHTQHGVSACPGMRPTATSPKITSAANLLPPPCMHTDAISAVDGKERVVIGFVHVLLS